MTRVHLNPADVIKTHERSYCFDGIFILYRRQFGHVLTCASSDDKEDEEYEKEEVGEDGEIVLVSGDKVLGPWSKSGAAPPPAAPVGE